MSSTALPEGWELINTVEVQANAIREDMFLSNSLQGLNLTNEITARIQEDLNTALTNLCRKTPVVFVRILCRCKGSISVNINGSQDHNNHSPPAAWNYFIIERKGNQMSEPLIELYLFPER